jgi:hypothetical protein
MTEEEFKEFYFSLTDEEKIEVTLKLSNFVKENREHFDYTDEYIAEKDERLARYIKVVEQEKQVKKLLRQAETQLDLVTQRIEARLLDKIETESPQFLDDDKNKNSH